MSEVGKKSKPITKRRGKKKKDPNAPKKPRSAYIIFCTEERANVKKSHPDAKPADILKIMAEMWRQCSDAQKKEYAEKAGEDKNRYNAQMTDYHPPADEEDDDRGKGKKGKRGKKKKKDPNEPKRGQTAYILFGNKQRPIIKSENPNISQSEIMKMIGARWNAMDEAEKKQYHDEAEADKQRYEREKSAYDKKKGSAAGGGAKDGSDEEMGDDDNASEDQGDQMGGGDGDGGDDDHDDGGDDDDEDDDDGDE